MTVAGGCRDPAATHSIMLWPPRGPVRHGNRASTAQLPRMAVSIVIQFGRLEDFTTLFVPANTDLVYTLFSRTPRHALRDRLEPRQT